MDSRLATDNGQPDVLAEALNSPPAKLLEQVVNLGPMDTKRVVLERRMVVARLRLLGVRNQTYIAEILGVNKSTVCKDFQALDRLWRSEMAENIQAEKAFDLGRIEAAIAQIMPGAERGEFRAVDALVDLLERKAKMLGYDAPTTREVDWRVELGKAGVVDADTLYQEVVMLVHQRVRTRQGSSGGPGAWRRLPEEAFP